ncbi:MAG: hypothetical protein RQ756_08790 [Flavobacteriaceae bacterium]|nr:hypothetical protein [Flavobacteriaceae bacterium]
MQQPLFSERQKFKLIWMWLILIPIGLLMLYGLVQQIIFDIPFGGNPAPNAVLLQGALIPFGIAVLFYLLTLETYIDEQQIKFKFYPLLKERSYRWEEIDTAEVINYGFVGGWGIRWGTKYGTVYNTSGKMGMRIVLKSGKKFVIGTQQPEKADAVIKKITQA